MDTDILNWLQVNILNNPKVFLSIVALIVMIIVFYLFPAKSIKIDRSRRRWVWTVSIFVLAMFIFLYTNIVDLANTLIVWSTLVLAAVAIFSFQESRRLREENRQREDHERKERLLNEIISWASDIAKTAINRQTKEINELWKTKLDYKYHNSKGKYIEEIIISNNFEELSNSLEIVFIKLNNVFEVTGFEADKKKKKDVDSNKLKKCETELVDVVEDFLKETAKLKP